MSTLILRPNSDTATAQQKCSSGVTHYILIDEATKDEADYCFNPDTLTSTKTDLYDFPNQYAELGTINSVTVKLYAKYILYGTSDGTAYVKPMIRVSDTEYGDNQALTDTVALYSQTWTTNPYTSEAWTWKQIDALIAGDSLTNYATDKKNYKAACCYQLWVEVDYRASYNKACTVGMSLTPSDSELADFVKAASAGLSLASNPSEVADFPASASVGLSLGVTPAEVADFIVAVAVALNMTTASSEVADFPVSASAGLGLSVSNSELADFVRAATVGINLAASDSEVGDFIRSALVNMSLSASNGEVADFVKTLTAAIAIAGAVGATTLYSVSAVTYSAGDLKVSLVFNNNSIKYVH
jgi:hypothetical protein